MFGFLFFLWLLPSITRSRLSLPVVFHLCYMRLAKVPLTRGIGTLYIFGDILGNRIISKIQIKESRPLHCLD